MSPSTLHELFSTHPDQPYKLTLASGDRLTIDNPRRTLVVASELYVGVSDVLEDPIGQRVRIVPIPNIAQIEPIDRAKIVRLRGRRPRP